MTAADLPLLVKQLELNARQLEAHGYRRSARLMRLAAAALASPERSPADWQDVKEDDR